MNKKTGYPTGVYRNAGGKSFRARLYDKGKFIYLGSFGSAEEASIAYIKERQLRKLEIKSKSKNQPLQELKGTPFYGL